MKKELSRILENLVEVRVIDQEQKKQEGRGWETRPAPDRKKRQTLGFGFVFMYYYLMLRGGTLSTQSMG